MGMCSKLLAAWLLASSPLAYAGVSREAAVEHARTVAHYFNSSAPKLVLLEPALSSLGRADLNDPALRSSLEPVIQAAARDILGKIAPEHADLVTAEKLQLLSTAFRPYLTEEQRRQVGEALPLYRAQLSSPDLISKAESVAKTLGWHPDQVEVQGTEVASDRKKLLVDKALETHSRVADNQRLKPNFSGFHVSAAVELSNGKWFSADNAELSRELTLCGERTAILSALGSPSAGNCSIVRTVVVSNSDWSFKKLCSDCLSWLATGKYFTPDTQIVSVARDKSTGRFSLKIRAIKDVLPFHVPSLDKPSVSDQSVESLPLLPSQRAKHVMEQERLSSRNLSKLMQAAQKAFVARSAGKFSTKPAAAVVQLSPFGTSSSIRFQWAPRFSEAEDLQAAAAAIERTVKLQSILARVLRVLDRFTLDLFGFEKRWSGFLQKPTLQAIAYYGEDKNLPPIVSIGRLVKQGATNDTLILKLEDHRVQVRALGEYMTEIYGLEDYPPENHAATDDSLTALIDAGLRPQEARALVAYIRIRADRLAHIMSRGDITNETKDLLKDPLLLAVLLGVKPISSLDLERINRRELESAISFIDPKIRSKWIPQSDRTEFLAYHPQHVLEAMQEATLTKKAEISFTYELRRLNNDEDAARWIKQFNEKLDDRIGILFGFPPNDVIDYIKTTKIARSAHERGMTFRSDEQGHRWVTTLPNYKANLFVYLWDRFNFWRAYRKQSGIKIAFRLDAKHHFIAWTTWNPNHPLTKRAVIRYLTAFQIAEKALN